MRVLIAIIIIEFIYIVARLTLGLCKAAKLGDEMLEREEEELRKKEQGG